MKAITLLSALTLLCLVSVKSTPVIRDQSKSTTLSYSPNASDVFGAFHAHRQQNGIALQWNVTVNDVTDFAIERSYDGSFFETIDHCAPVAGAWNKYNDNAVFPGYTYYRIKAIRADGSMEYSDIEVVRIVKHG